MSAWKCSCFWVSSVLSVVVVMWLSSKATVSNIGYANGVGCTQLALPSRGHFDYLQNWGESISVRWT